jgi:hypothetical protein
METGADILFFWVARMAMLCTQFTDQPPFETIFLHPLVCGGTGPALSDDCPRIKLQRCTVPISNPEQSTPRAWRPDLPPEHAKVKE